MRVLSGLAIALLCSAAAFAATPEIPNLDFDKDAPVLFQADRASYDVDGRVVRLTGNVEIYSDGRLLTADEVAYDQTTGVVTATGNVVIRERNGETLTADHVQLTGDLREGVIENIGYIIDEHTRLAAARGTRTAGNVNTLESAVFTPCQVCAANPVPLWQIKAVRVVWDEKQRRISYENATFELFGTAIATVPAFSHADFTVQNQTGFLAPSGGHSNDLGYFVEIPYHFALDPSYDFTLGLMVATDVNPVLKAEFRQKTLTGSYYLAGSLTYDDAVDGLGNPTGENTTYGHLFGRGRFTLSDTTSWGFDIERASSDTYLRRYEISDIDRLTSRAYWSWRSGRSFADVSSYLFQGLRATDDPGLTPFVLPEAQLHYVFDDLVLGGELAFDGNILALTRSRGLDTQRVSAGLSWDRQLILDGGQAVRLFAHSRGDLYRLTDPDPVLNPGVEDGEIFTRFTGYAGIDLRWPFVRRIEGASQVLEPIAQLILAPYGDGPEEIPNEDSLSLEFDDTNLFKPVKFTGLDLIETGPRANVGVRFAQYFDDGASFEVMGGFQFRTDDDPAFLGATGLGETQSDIVGRISVTPWTGLTIVNRLRLDKDDFSVRRNEVYVQGTGSFYEIDASYLKLESDPTLTGLGPREEISVLTRVYVAQYWSLIGGIRRDLEDDEMIESRFAFAYEDECSFLELGFRRRYTSDRDAEPSTTVLLRVRLKALGDDGPAEPLFERDPYLGAESRDLRDFDGF